MIELLLHEQKYSNFTVLKSEEWSNSEADKFIEMIRKMEALEEQINQLKSDKGVLEIAIKNVHLPEINQYEQTLKQIKKAYEQKDNNRLEEILNSINFSS